MQHNNPLLISADSFEGPVELLLYLIEKNKLQINTVSLSEVTQSFLDITKKMIIPTSVLADFVATTATLIYIKSRTLLPFALPLSIEEERGNILQHRLRALHHIRHVATYFCFDLKSSGLIIRPSVKKCKKKMFKNDESLSLREIQTIVSGCFVEKQALSQLKIKTTVTLEEMSERVISLLNEIPQKNNKSTDVTLNEIFVKNKQEIIVLFLAVLELFKQNKIKVNQQSGFGILTLGSYEQ